MANWHRDVARRKAREKLQRAQERRDAERWEKMLKGLRLKDERQERAFKKSGCETMEEFLELQRGRGRSPRARAGRARTTPAGLLRGLRREAGGVAERPGTGERVDVHPHRRTARPASGPAD